MAVRDVIFGIGKKAVDKGTGKFRETLSSLGGKSTRPGPTPDEISQLTGRARIRAEEAARKAARAAERDAGTRRGSFTDLAYRSAIRYPKTALGVGGTVAAGLYSPFSSVIRGLGGDEPQYDITRIQALTPQEQYLKMQEKALETAYAPDQDLETQFQTEAYTRANQAAKAYEDMGRPDLAEGARQEVLNTYNQYRLQGLAQSSLARREALQTAQEAAAALPSTRTTPSELRSLANTYASDYFSLNDEDRAYYANLGYGTVEQFIQGKINGEI